MNQDKLPSVSCNLVNVLNPTRHNNPYLCNIILEIQIHSYETTLNYGFKIVQSPLFRSQRLQYHQELWKSQFLDFLNLFGGIRE